MTSPLAWIDDLPSPAVVVPVRTEVGVLEFSYRDLLAYHGGRSECGAALALVMAKAVTDRWAEPISRETLSVRCAIRGEGIVDGLECLYRCVSRSSLTVDTSTGRGTGAPSGPEEGCFYFEFITPARKTTLTLLHSRPFEAYMARCSDPGETPERRGARRAFVAHLLTNPVEQTLSVV